MHYFSFHLIIIQMGNGLCDFLFLKSKIFININKRLGEAQVLMTLAKKKSQLGRRNRYKEIVKIQPIKSIAIVKRQRVEKDTSKFLQDVHSKLQSFLSLQMHHIRHMRTIFQISLVEKKNNHSLRHNLCKPPFCQRNHPTRALVISQLSGKLSSI